MKLQRNDLVRAAIRRLQEGAEEELRSAQEAELVARQEFFRCARAEALCRNTTVLEQACKLCGTVPARLDADVLLDISDEVLAAPPSQVGVLLRDGPIYEARLVMRLSIAIRGVDEEAMRAWLGAVRRRRIAERRSTKAKDLGADGKSEAIVGLLEGEEEGRRILELLDQLVQKLEL